MILSRDLCAAVNIQCRPTLASFRLELSVTFYIKHQGQMALTGAKTRINSAGIKIE